MELKQKYGKKKITIIISSIVFVLIGIGIWYVNEQNKKQNALDSIDIVFKDDVLVEYGQEKVDFNDFIKEKKGNPKITLPTNKIDTKKLEKKEVIYTLSKNGYSKDKNLTIEVKDTKVPEIVFKEESLTLEHGVKFDIKTNINSIKDIVDGDIPFEEKAKESNYYVIEGTVDTSITGDYKIKVIAVDKNGLKTEKEYSVHVNEENQPSNETAIYDPKTGSFVKKPTENNGGGNNGGNTGNTGGNGSSGGGETGGGGAVEQPHYRSDIAGAYASQINAYRQQNGLSALPITGEAQAEADMRAMQLVSSYGHNGSFGFGENIGMGDAGYNFFEAWKASPGHNGNMLEASMYSEFAVSVVEYSGQWYAVTSFRTNY